MIIFLIYAQDDFKCDEGADEALFNYKVALFIKPLRTLELLKRPAHFSCCIVH